MITLKETGTFAEFFDRYDIDRPTNTCQLFWKTILLSGALAAAGGVAAMYLLGAVLLFVPYGLHPTTLFFLMVSACIVILGSIYLIDRSIHEGKLADFAARERTQWEKNISEAYRGFKEKYCPIVSYRRKSDES